MSLSPLLRVRHALKTLVLALLVATMAAPSQVALAADTTVVITEDQIVRQAEGTPPTNAWVLYTRNPASSTATGAFRLGPGTPAEGVGSIELSTPASSDKIYLFNYEYLGQPLDEFSAISYATYRTTGNLQQITALNIQVDVNGEAAGGFTTLVFEPVYNTPQGVVQNSVWQSWDAINGGSARWWSTQPIPGVCAFNCFVEWQTILTNNPDAVAGAIGINQGSGNPNLTAAVDYLTLGTNGDDTTYDFEPFVVATTKEQCMNDGWQVVRRADGSEFKNQGDCIQYVNTGK